MPKYEEKKDQTQFSKNGVFVKAIMRIHQSKKSIPKKLNTPDALCMMDKTLLICGLYIVKCGDNGRALLEVIINSKFKY
jgi:hypothetical protein